MVQCEPERFGSVHQDLKVGRLLVSVEECLCEGAFPSGRLRARLAIVAGINRLRDCPTDKLAMSKGTKEFKLTVAERSAGYVVDRREFALCVQYGALAIG